VQGGRGPAGRARPAAAQGAQEPIQRRWAGGEQDVADGSVEPQAVVLLERCEQRGDHRRQEFAAEMIAGLPHAVQDGQQLRPILSRAA
jgi:hypothetical protein